MKLPLKWLKDYIDPKLSTEALIERLTMAGLEIEAVEQVGLDTVLEIEVTPNRPDCLNILGLAREVGAITAKAVKYPAIKNHRVAALKGIVSIEDKKDCCRYMATVIRDVKISDSSDVMKQHLASVGIKAINNAVDITNFVLMEVGQPLHAFDYDKLSGGKIMVRRARQGEKIITLDGVERSLDPNILVIADAQKPVAIAGVMGGAATQITRDTKNILLESAHFDMGLVRRASRLLGLRSDSSYRFERNVNIDGVLAGANRATDLLLTMTNGQVKGRVEIFVQQKKTTTAIKLKADAIESLLGFAVKPMTARAALTRLDFKVTAKKDALTVVVPSNRADVKQDVDVIEEIARMIGFDKLPSSMPVIKAANITVDNRAREIKANIRRCLTAQGLDEAVTLSMINTKALIKTKLADIPKVKVFNPLSQDQELMRPSMLPSMLQVAVTNINRGQKDLRLFEIGKRYFVDAEKDSLAILMMGHRHQDWRLSKKEEIEFFDLKRIVEQFFTAIGIKPTYVPNEFAVLENSNACSIKLNGKYLGSLGRVDRQILNNWDIKNQDIYFAGIHLDEIYPEPTKPYRYQPVSEFPTIIRDVSLAVKKDLPYKKIEDICLAQGGEILKSVQFIEQYLGDKVQPGLKGLVFSCQYQSNLRTLREDEVSKVHEGILLTLSQQLGAVRR